jgi:hypothetical protein
MNTNILQQQDMAEVQEHVVNAIKNATMFTDPSPHFYVESVFPEWFYEEIRASLPEDGLYEGSSYARTANTRAHNYRTRFPIDSMHLSSLSEGPANCIGALASVLAGSAFMDAIGQAFFPYWHFRPDLQNENTSYSVRTELVRDKTDYGIGPHTDAPFKVITLLFYIPPDDKFIDCGTSFYLPEQEGFTNWEGMHLPYEGFKLHKTVDYKPNTVIGFMKTANSFHGVEVIKHQNIVRDLIHWVLMARQTQ